MFVYFGSDSLGRNSNDFHYQKKKIQNKKETETATSKQENISLMCWLNSGAKRSKNRVNHWFAFLWTEPISFKFSRQHSPHGVSRALNNEQTLPVSHKL